MRERTEINAKHKHCVCTDSDYLNCVSDLINHKKIRDMQNFIQHGDITCFEHCLYVSYCSYVLCSKLRLNFRAAARGGLMHDLFLYDWHEGDTYEGLHGPRHPSIALCNAERYFKLSKLERDIIIKHMWPLTAVPPRYLESLIVLVVDKYCAFRETFRLINKSTIHRLFERLCF